MLPAPCYIISDAHLGVADRSAELALTGFLRAARGDAGALVINGDLFDFWYEWNHVIPRAGFRVLAEVAAFADAGLPVLWLAGNHDCWGAEVVQKDVGAEYVLGSWRGDVAGWRAAIDHGDGLRGSEDRKYRAVRPIMRNTLAIRAFRHLLHPDWASRLALGTSATSRTYSAADGGAGLRAVAFRDLEADSSLDLRVLGHSHVPALERAPGGGVYGNAGTWLGDSTYLRVTAERIDLRRWSPQGDVLVRTEPRQPRS